MIDARSDPVQDHDRGQEIAATELEGGRAVDRHHAIEKEERDPAPVLDRLLVDERIVATRTPGQVDLWRTGAAEDGILEEVAAAAVVEAVVEEQAEVEGLVGEAAVLVITTPGGTSGRARPSRNPSQR